MKRIRVLVDGMPHGVLRDLVKQLIAKCDDMQLIEGDTDPARLAKLVVRESADAVVLALDEHELPDACTRLLDQVPHLLVVGIVSDGQRMTAIQTMQNDVGSRELVDTIRAALGTAIQPQP